MRMFLLILGYAGGVVLLILAGVGIAVWTVDPNDLVGPLQARIKAATGRDVTIGGGIELKLGLVPKLIVNDVRVGNAPWAKTPDLLSAKRVEVEVALLPLLQRRFELVRLNLIEPVIALETNAKGRGNWELTVPSSDTGAPKADSGAIPLGIDDLSMKRGALTFRDGATGSETHVTIDELALRARNAQSPVNAEFRGTIDGIAVALTGNLGPLSTLSDRRLPYPVTVQGVLAGRKSALSAKVQRADDLVDLQDLDITSGSSNIKGRVEIRNGGPKATYTINLASAALALEDLALPQAALAAATPATSSTGGSKRFVFSDAALPLEALRGKDANGDIAIEKLTLPGGRQLSKVHVQFTLRDGKLDAPAVQASAFGGTASAILTVNAVRGQTPAIALRIDGNDLDLGPLLATAGVVREVRGGKTSVAINVTMHGNSLHQWMSGINGRARVVVGPATFVNAKLDPTQSFDRLSGAVNPFRAGSATTELQCAVITLPLAGGVAHVDHSIAVETKQLDATASGTVDFRNETLDLSIRPRIRQGIAVEIPQIAEVVRLRGSFAAPTVGVDAMAATAAIAGLMAGGRTRGGLGAVLGQATVAPSGAGACAVALGKVSAAGSPDAANRGPAATGVEDLTKALGGLFKR